MGKTSISVPEMRIMLDSFEDWYSKQFHYKMRVARLISKRYNHHGKQNSTAAAGSVNSLPPATCALAARCNRISVPQGYAYAVHRAVSQWKPLVVSARLEAK